MNTVKIVIGVILGLSGTITFTQMMGEESGAGLGGAFFGFLILGGIAALLIYSGVKGNQNNS